MMVAPVGLESSTVPLTPQAAQPAPFTGDHAELCRPQSASSSGSISAPSPVNRTEMKAFDLVRAAHFGQR